MPNAINFSPKNCSKCHWILYILACIQLVCVIKLFIASTDIAVSSMVPAPEKLQRQRSTAYIKQSPRPPIGTCGQVYLFGGGKSGSTTLWFTLTGGPGGINNELNSGPFPTQSFLKERGVGKEPCYNGPQWENWTKFAMDSSICSVDKNLPMQRTHIINGCPRHTSMIDAKSIVDFAGTNHTKFITLIRDPIDRLVSQLNDQVRRFGYKKSVENQALKLARSNRTSGLVLRLSYQGKMLFNLLSVVRREDVLIVPMESMKVDMQGLVDSAMDHIGGERWEINATGAFHRNDGRGNDGSFNYTTVTDATRDELREKFREDVLLLEKLVGRHFSWSSWAYVDEKDTDLRNESWLVAQPIGLSSSAMRKRYKGKGRIVQSSQG